MILIATLIAVQVATAAEQVSPVLAFPEPGLDDSVAYQGYRTRFLRDAAGNTVQIYIRQREGRVVHLWADGANASAGFTARNAQGLPARLTWGSGSVTVASSGLTRFVEYSLTSDAAPLEIGRFLLGSMRLERDFQYQQGHLAPFGAAGIEQPELLEAITHLEQLDPAERRRHLDLLHAADIPQLRSRLRPTFRYGNSGDRRTVRVEQPTFDGRNRLSLEFVVEDGSAAIDTATHSVTFLPGNGRTLRLLVRVATDAPTLVPLTSDQIFNADFLRFHSRLRGDSTDLSRFRRLDREVRMAELVSFEEKLMAGLPNFATYFGRDMIMSALMMEPILTPAMLEHVIAGVLRKLESTGEVSHEEALGGQAIREHAAEYNALVSRALRARRRGDGIAADSLLGDARAVLADLQRVRESYHMVDDDFQLPVLVARYLANPRIAADRKREFLLAPDQPAGETRLRALVKNLAFVARQAAPYARAPVTADLVSFARRADGRWAASSWRDSGAGYGNGRYAMDVNAIWVPAALSATEAIVAELKRLGWRGTALAGLVPGVPGAELRSYILDPQALRAALHTWRSARRHFEVHLSPGEITARLSGWTDRLPETERAFWREQAGALETDAGSIRFLALSLDSAGQQIPVINTDPAMLWFLEDVTAQVLRGERRAETALDELQPFLRSYPLGLMVEGLGPLVANDAFASRDVQDAFRQDPYHSPRVVWGREVNLLLLGLARQVAAAYDSAGRLRRADLDDYTKALVQALARTMAAVDASGLKHNELWSYRIEGGRLEPVRYATSSDIQLWNVTDLAVQYVLDQLPGPVTALLSAAQRQAGRR